MLTFKVERGEIYYSDENPSGHFNSPICIPFQIENTLKLLKFSNLILKWETFRVFEICQMKN